jgi:autophagy-related protein 17
MSTSSLNRSHASLSPAASQSNSVAHDEISLETLVSHLLASKRSLSSVSAVWRANEILRSARSTLEESSVLSARTGYLRTGISEQVKVLRKVRSGIGDVYKFGKQDFNVRQCIEGDGTTS